MHRPTRFYLLALALLTAAPACVQRRITLTSEPSGALVFLNDEEVGRTPVTVPFTFYGNYDVRLLLDHHQPIWTAREANPPWWDQIGPDLIAEMIPHARSNIAWHFTLEPTPPLDEKALINRANNLRATATQTQDKPE